MSRIEWLDITEWISDRFSRPWTQKQSEAFYHDLKGFDLGRVKEAVHTLYGKGLTRPPTGSEILSLVVQISSDDEKVRNPMEDCRHLPIDDEGYCTACGGVPKLGKLLDDVDLPLDQISASSRKTRELLTTVIGTPPDLPDPTLSG